MLANQAAAAGVEGVVVDETDETGFAREIADAEVLLHVLEPVTEAMIARAPRLRLIQKLGVGVNTIDLEAARAAGVGPGSPYWARSPDLRSRHGLRVDR